jgi:3-oxoacyl-[acyl-carrier-protein] synthase II
MSFKRVVVTGIGALTPLGGNYPEYWDNLLSGISGAGMITRFDTSLFKTKFACEVKGYNPENHFEKKEIKRLDPFLQYASISTEEAVKDADLNFSTLDRERIGVIWGSGIGGVRTFIDEIRNFSLGDGSPHFNPFFIPKLITNMAPGYLSIKYGLYGPSFAVTSACASSNHALIDALNYIRLGIADMMLCGGSEAIINEAAVGGFNAMHAMSTRNDSPSTASRPFDKDRDGFVAGEGSGTLILESLEHAKNRGAKIYAEFAGGGMSSDGYHITATHPDGFGAKIAMKNALLNASMNVEDIDYINAHGTSTPLGDISEIRAISTLFGESAYNLNISSTKSMTGHLLGAAGVIEAIASILAVRGDIVPPTINHFTEDPDFDPKLNLTFNTSQKRVVRAAISNAFGFGGHNTSVIFKKFIE